MYQNHGLVPKTPKIKFQPTWNTTEQEPVSVYCRLRPVLTQGEEICLKVNSQSEIQMKSPKTATNYRDGKFKEFTYTFTKVFDQDASQRDVFYHAALPLVENLLHGKNGLMFTYGITGSGKTYTMSGTIQNTGIVPRALHVVFNSIRGNQANKFVFKPDNFNGFELQSAEEAKQDAFQENATNRQTSRPLQRQESYTLDPTKVEKINLDNLYAVFVTYIEIYNNFVFDLLDDKIEEVSKNSKFKVRLPQSKILREDGLKNMYAHGVTEVEVTSAEEAFDVFTKGLGRRRIANNTLNPESSRSHCVFTVRLVWAPLDENGENIIQDNRSISISQLSFVDLAGGERTCRTNTTGERLREAGNINNSLMNLRVCLEILRENQRNNTNKLVPYRATKLTHLFKNYFEGSSLIRVIICVNPSSKDYDENVHTMQFAEITQEVQVLKPMTFPNIHEALGLMTGRKEANLLFKQDMMELGLKQDREKEDFINNTNSIDLPAAHRLAVPFPNLCLDWPSNDKVLKNLMVFLEGQIINRNIVQAEIKSKENAFVTKVHENEKELLTAKHEISNLSAVNKQLIVQVTTLESQLKAAKKQLREQCLWHEKFLKGPQEEVEISNNKATKLRNLSEENLETSLNNILFTGSEDCLAVPFNVTLRKKENDILTIRAVKRYRSMLKLQKRSHLNPFNS